MEIREVVIVVVRVVSGGLNSLRGQIGLERVLRWKSRLSRSDAFWGHSQAKLEQERCDGRLEDDRQHKYRRGEIRPPG